MRLDEGWELIYVQTFTESRWDTQSSQFTFPAFSQILSECIFHLLPPEKAGEWQANWFN